MAFRSELEQIDVATLMEGLVTLVSAAGLPAYMGWHGDSVSAFGLYALVAGVALTGGMVALHPPPTMAPASVAVLWLVQTLAVAVFGGIAFQVAAQFH